MVNDSETASCSGNMDPRHSDSDTDHEDVTGPRKKTVSERKRQQLAIFNSWLERHLVRSRADQLTVPLRKNERAQSGLLQQSEGSGKVVADELTSVQALARRQESKVIISDPRDYQMELFEKAKQENIVAVLDTGSGKTLIAVLLLRYMFDQELARRSAGLRPRLAFFLVHSVALVYQQFAVLECNLNQKVERFAGDMNVDSWSREIWDKHFEDNMAIVCTADILLNCLFRSHISMERISLLIFDEAHHAKRNHAYARIIKEFYLEQQADCRPRIFGMTASPVDVKADPVHAARELEVIMHCRIATTQNLALLRNFISRPTERVIEYDPLRLRCTTTLYDKLESRFGTFRIFASAFGSAKAAAVELGTWCADQFWATRFTDEEVQKMEDAESRTLSNRGASKEIIDRHVSFIREAKALIDGEIALRPFPARDNGVLSSKVLALDGILGHQYDRPTETRSIVFVKRRSTARLLAAVFASIGPPHMRHDVLIGTRQSESGDPNVSIRGQLLTLTRFRKGELNLLFATSVAEEGLDIPLCNSVIRFDLYETLIQYIQSRGRARHMQSEYVHMVERNNQEHLSALRDVRSGEMVLQNFCQKLPKDRLLQGCDDINLDDAVAQERRLPIYREPSTGAKLTYRSALQVLVQFSDTLPRDAEAITRPTYVMTTEGKLFRCEVLLPRNSPIRSVIGRAYPRKIHARSSAAFEACLKLRQNGYLDEYLRSKFEKQLPAMRNARLAVSAKKTSEYDCKLKPQFWEQGIGEEPSELFVTIIDLGDSAATGRSQSPLAVLTRRLLPAIPAFPIFPLPGCRCGVSMTSLDAALPVVAATTSRLTSFTLRVFYHLFNKVFENEQKLLPYWIAPVTPEWKRHSSEQATIDWDVVNLVHDKEYIEWSLDLQDSDTTNKFIVDRGHGGLRYFTVCRAPELRPMDPVPEGCVTQNHAKQSSILDYSSSLWKKSRTRVHYEEEQPVYLAHQFTNRRNWLDDWSENERSERSKAYLCLQPLLISTIPANFAETGFFFPSIVWRLEAYLIAIEACSGLGLKVPPSLALEAITKDSDNTEEHRAEQIHFQRGMGKNYERLEFIGDCFLKMATSISLYAQNANDDEFESHVKRMLMICNRNLLDTALDLGVPQFIRTKAFERRLWYPPGLKLIAGRGVNAKEKLGDKKHRLNDKAIADVCEAIIGAALLTERKEGKMDMAVRSVTLFTKNSNHDIASWDEYYKLYNLPAYQTGSANPAQIKLVDQIADIMGYRFRYPGLLQSAFTHPSYPVAWGGVPCYQRLEFLGDSLLDMACVNFLFFSNPDRDPQWLTEHKMAMVANKFLGALCVRLKFHNQLRQNHIILVHQITNYVTEVREAEDAADGSPNYWTQTKDPPKCLADVVEAYLGALFVDSEFSYAPIEAFFDRHIRPFFLDMSLYDTFANAHPTTHLAHFLAQVCQCSHWRLMSDEAEPGAGSEEGQPPTIIAVVMIHFKIVASSEGTSGRYAKERASHRALEELEQMNPKDFKEKFKCDCTPQDQGLNGALEKTADSAV